MFRSGCLFNRTRVFLFKRKPKKVYIIEKLVGTWDRWCIIIKGTEGLGANARPVSCSDTLH